MQVEAERPEPDGIQPPGDDVKGGTFLGDEQHPPAVGDGPGQQVGDRLRLPGSGRALEHEGAAGGRLADRGDLGRVGRYRAGRGEFVQIDTVRAAVTGSTNGSNGELTRCCTSGFAIRSGQ